MRSGGHGILAALVLLLAAALLGGETRLVWTGAAALVAAAAALVVVLGGFVARPAVGRAGLAALALVGGFAVWVGASVLWSELPDRSWDSFNRLLVYLAFLALGLAAGALLPRAERVYANALAGLLGLVLAWALLEKVFALDDPRRARLHEPLGYWNTLGLLAATAVPLALRLRRRTTRALLLYAAVVVVLLTQSRGALLLAALAAAGWLALERGRRVEAGAALTVAVPPAFVTGALGLALDGVSKDGQPHADRLADGLSLGLALLTGAVAVATLARLELPPRVLRGAALAAAVAALAGLGALVVRAGGPVDFVRDRVEEFQEPVTPESPTRLVETSSNNRAEWWREAVHGFADHPLAGNGAGAFQVTHRRYRESSVEVREPHSLPLQLLSETGLVGFALLVGAAVAAAIAARRREPALVLTVAVFAGGTLEDIHWDFVAAGAIAFATLGVLLARGTAERRRNAVWAAGVAALALAALYSLGAPWLADRRLDDAFSAIEAGDLDVAAARARSARSLNPVSVEPLFALGFVEFARGQFDRARDDYARATEVQPENRETWFQLGRLEYEVGRYADAYGRFNRMYALDPHGPHSAWVVRARCKLNPTGCPPSP